MIFHLIQAPYSSNLNNSLYPAKRTTRADMYVHGKPSSFPTHASRPYNSNVQGTPVTEEVILTAKVVKARSVAKDVPVVQVPSV